jgi:phosphoglycerate dehydrogenase-like enzyme
LELHVRYATEPELLAASDFLCMLVPFFPETEQALSRDFFAAMKPGAIFVSCGGSGVVDEAALAAALRQGHLYGAALDTYTFEPISLDDPMLPLARPPQANIILTPHWHKAAWTARVHAQTVLWRIPRACLMQRHPSWH